MHPREEVKSKSTVTVTVTVTVQEVPLCLGTKGQRGTSNMLQLALTGWPRLGGSPGSDRVRVFQVGPTVRSKMDPEKDQIRKPRQSLKVTWVDSIGLPDPGRLRRSVLDLKSCCRGRRRRATVTVTVTVTDTVTVTVTGHKIYISKNTSTKPP